MPFVLRPVASTGGNDNGKSHAERDDDDDEGEIRRYTLIGDCYVTGMMHGEALLDSRYEEIAVQLV